DVEVTIKEKDGVEVYIGTTENDGTVKTNDPLEHGKTYEVIKDGEVLGEFTKDLLDCEYEVQPDRTCPVFEVTIKDQYGEPEEGKEVTIQEKDGDVIYTDTTGEDGKITTEKPLTPG